MTTIIDLPMPPSVNRIWRYSRVTGKAYLDTRYQTWKRVADNYYLEHKKDWLPVPGHFKASVTLDIKHRGRSDLDNRIKGLLDWLQRVEIIEDDKLCDGLTVTWGRAPEGCRVRLTPVAFRSVVRKAA